MHQFFEVTGSMNEVIDIRIVADCDIRYGNAINAMHMVKSNKKHATQQS